MAPKRARRIFFPTNLDLADILGRTDLDFENLYFFPQPLVDGFSKLWLRGKGNLGVETLIPAGSVLGFMPGPCSRKKTCKNSNIYKVFGMLDSKIAIFTMIF